MISLSVDKDAEIIDAFNSTSRYFDDLLNIAVEYSSCFISVMNLDIYVRWFDSLMSRGPSRGPNNFYVYI